MIQNDNFQKFDQGMKKILRADPKAVKAEMEREKKENAKKRKAKTPSVDHASSSRDA